MDTQTHDTSVSKTAVSTPRAKKPGIIALEALKSIGFVSFNGGAFLTIAKTDAEGNVVEMMDLPAAQLIGLTDGNLTVFVNQNDPASSEVKKLKAAIRTLRDGGLNDLADEAEKTLTEKLGK